ncbi:MAG: ATP synthase F1 subunit epsilon [Anaerolineales bacterium]|nr:ATP synthase F1 subunit epsilon [Anaerolineales bacterium]
MPIHCSIVSQDHRIFDGDADMVIVPGIEGEMGVLPQHSPLLTLLDVGVVRIKIAGEQRQEIFTVTGGVVDIRPDEVIILADASEHLAEIDVERAQAAKDRAQAMLEEGPPPDPDAFLALEAALRRSKLRVDAVRKYRKDSTDFGSLFSDKSSTQDKKDQ